MSCVARRSMQTPGHSLSGSPHRTVVCNPLSTSQVQNEVYIMHKLRHSNTLKFYNWYATRNHVWLILEYVTGGDLNTLLTQDKRLPESVIKVQCAAHLPQACGNDTTAHARAYLLLCRGTGVWRGSHGWAAVHAFQRRAVLRPEAFQRAQQRVRCAQGAHSPAWCTRPRPCSAPDTATHRRALLIQLCDFGLSRRVPARAEDIKLVSQPRAVCCGPHVALCITCGR